MSTTHQATRAVLQRCRELGFASAGIAEAAPTRYEPHLRQWLADGKHGEMQYLAQHLEQRIDPRTMAPGVPGAKSIICVADRYDAGGADEPEPHCVNGQTVIGSHDRPVGRIARYARGDDYHLVMKKRLHRLTDELAGRFADETFRVCVDTAPVLEREHAQRAGLGAVGKHTLLIEPGVGSYLLLGEIITTLDLVPCASCETDPCGSCTRCIEACPTDAITAFSVDATRCISYLTIEHRSAIDERYHDAMGKWIFGCDICQDVCPHNQPTERSRTAVVHEAYAARRDGFDLLEVLNWSQQSRRDAFVRSAMKRAKLPMMKRNALIAAGNWLANANDEALAQRIAEISADEAEDDLVRSTARAVLRRLNEIRPGVTREG